MKSVIFVLLIGFAGSSFSSSQNDNEYLSKIVDFDYIEKTNNHVATSLKTVEALSKAYNYVFNSENKVAKYDQDFYTVNLFVLKEAYVIRFFIPIKSRVIVEPWNDFQNYVLIGRNSGTIKSINHEEAFELIKELESNKNLSDR